MKILVNLLLTAAALFLADFLMDSVRIDGVLIALLSGIALGFVNALIRPIVIILTLPINILTLGLFTLVINALMVMLVAAIVPGFSVAGFWSALLFSLFLSIFRIIFNRLT